MSNNISEAHKSQIGNLLREQRFIEAIKLYRSVTGCDLRRAKLEVEQLQKTLGIPSQSSFAAFTRGLAGPLLLLGLVIVIIIAIVWLAG